MERDSAGRRAGLLRDLDGLRAEVDVEKRIGHLILDRPPLNIVSYRARHQIRGLLEEMDEDDDIGVICIRGANGVFSSGGDVKSFPSIPKNRMSDLADNIGTPERCRKPVIAALEKYCFGVGFELAMACDFRLATKDCLVALPESAIGQMPGSGGSVRVARIAGLTRAKDMVMLGKRIPAEQAVDWGLLTATAEDAEGLTALVHDYARRLNALAPISIQSLKRVLNSAYDTSLKVALDHLDAVIALIRAARNPPEARQGLVERFSLTEIQAQAILDMQLQRLTGLEREKILEELARLAEKIRELRAILESESLLLGIVIDELKEVREKYGDERRTEIIDGEDGDFSIEDLIVDEDVVITASNTGYIKRTAVTQYRNQRRGGKGRIGMRTREEDFLTHLFIASTHAFILIFTDRGRVYPLKVHRIPDVGPAGRGKAIANLVALDPDERIAALETLREFPADPGRRFVVMGTRRGIVKRVDLSAFRHVRAGGIIAMGVEPDDAVVGAELTDGHGEIFIGTRAGMAIRFGQADVRPMGRTARGVRGIRLREGDEVVAMTVVRPGATLLTVTENGYGKRTELGEYRVQSRGGVGIISIQASERNGRVAGVACVDADDEVLLITQQGKVLRMVARDARPIGRATQGVRLIGISDDDRVVSVARLVEREGDTREDAGEASDESVAGDG